MLLLQQYFIFTKDKTLSPTKCEVLCKNRVPDIFPRAEDLFLPCVSDTQRFLDTHNGRELKPNFSPSLNYEHSRNNPPPKKKQKNFSLTVYMGKHLNMSQPIPKKKNK